MKSKKYATYEKKSFVTIKIMKKNLKTKKKSEIIDITPEHLEQLLIANAI